MKPIEIDCPKCAAPAGDPCKATDVPPLSVQCDICGVLLGHRCRHIYGQRLKGGFHKGRGAAVAGITHLERSEAVARIAPKPITVPDRKAVNALYDDYQRQWNAAKDER